MCPHCQRIVSMYVTEHGYYYYSCQFCGLTSDSDRNKIVARKLWEQLVRDVEIDKLRQ